MAFSARPIGSHRYARCSTHTIGSLSAAQAAPCRACALHAQAPRPRRQRGHERPMQGPRSYPRRRMPSTNGSGYQPSGCCAHGRVEPAPPQGICRKGGHDASADHRDQQQDDVDADAKHLGSEREIAQRHARRRMSHRRTHRPRARAAAACSDCAPAAAAPRWHGQRRQKGEFQHRDDTERAEMRCEREGEAAREPHQATARRAASRRSRARPSSSARR